MKAYVQFGLDNSGYYKLMFIDNLEHYDRVLTGESDRMKGFKVLVELIREAVPSKLIASHGELAISNRCGLRCMGLLLC